MSPARGTPEIDRLEGTPNADPPPDGGKRGEARREASVARLAECDACCRDIVRGGSPSEWDAMAPSIEREEAWRVLNIHREASEALRGTPLGHSEASPLARPADSMVMRLRAREAGRGGGARERKAEVEEEERTEVGEREHG